jgi:hypothetical protein
MKFTKVEEILKGHGLSKLQAALLARISPSDFYQAMNGKRPFFPAWRKRLCEVLEVEESELFLNTVEKEVEECQE